MTTLDEYGTGIAPLLALERAVWAWQPGDPNPFDAVTAALRVRMLTATRWRRAYEVYLRSAAWHRKRDEVLTRATDRCEECGNGRSGLFARTGLQVHHWSYAMLGDEPLEHLEALCTDCHRHADLARRAGLGPVLA